MYNLNYYIYYYMSKYKTSIISVRYRRCFIIPMTHYYREWFKPFNAKQINIVNVLLSLNIGKKLWFTNRRKTSFDMQVKNLADTSKKDIKEISDINLRQIGLFLNKIFSFIIINV